MSTWPEQAEVSKQIGINEEFNVFSLEKLGGKYYMTCIFQPGKPLQS